jgi:site-specific recombinase XerD
VLGLTELRVRDGKGGEPRDIWLVNEAEGILVQWLRVREEWAANERREGSVCDALFPVDKRRGIANAALDGIIRDLLARAGLEGSGITPHCFRGYLATALDATPGVSLRDIADVLGHSSPLTTAGYLKSSKESQRAALEAQASARSADSRDGAVSHPDSPGVSIGGRRRIPGGLRRRATLR